MIRILGSVIVLILVLHLAVQNQALVRGQGDNPLTPNCTELIGQDGTPEGDPFPTVITSNDLEDIRAVEDENGLGWSIFFNVSKDGAPLLYDHTLNHILQPMGIVLDGYVLSVPIIQAAIGEFGGQITGDYTEKEAKILASQLNSGVLPLQLQVTETAIIGASEGSSSTGRITFDIVLDENVTVDAIDPELINETLVVLERRLAFLDLESLIITLDTNLSIVIEFDDDDYLDQILSIALQAGLLEFTDFSVSDDVPEAGSCVRTTALDKLLQQRAEGQPIMVPDPTNTPMAE